VVRVDVSLCECKSSSCPQGSLAASSSLFPPRDDVLHHALTAAAASSSCQSNGHVAQNSQSLDSQALTTHAFPRHTHTACRPPARA